MSTVHIFVLIDALGWPYVEHTQLLSQVLPYRVPVRTVLGYSSGAVPAILTGRLPSETGHWNLFYYDPDDSPFRWLRHFSFLPDAILEHRITRKALKELGRHWLGLGPLFECCVSPRYLAWFNYVEKKNLYAAGAMEHVSSIFDELEKQGVPYHVYSYHNYTDEQIFRQTLKDLEKSNSHFFFLYLSELDMFLHHHCKDPDAIKTRLGWYEQGIRQILSTADNLGHDAALTLFSDHGMTPVQHHADVIGEIESLGLRMPEDYLAVYDSTMARFWFFQSEARQRIRDRLQTLACGRVLSEPELEQLGVYFPDYRYGEVVFLMHPGWLMSRSDFSTKWMPAGMHGYDPADPYSDAVFLSNRTPPVTVTTIRDIYECMFAAVNEMSGLSREAGEPIRVVGD